MDIQRSSIKWILAMILACASVAYAQTSKGTVTAIHGDSIALMDEAGNIQDTPSKSSLAPLPWQILDVKANSLMKVHIAGKGDYWIKMTKVAFERPVTVSATCGPQLIQNQKVGGVRGIGEECKK